MNWIVCASCPGYFRPYGGGVHTADCPRFVEGDVAILGETHTDDEPTGQFVVGQTLKEELRETRAELEYLRSRDTELRDLTMTMSSVVDAARRLISKIGGRRVWSREETELDDALKQLEPTPFRRDTRPR